MAINFKSALGTHAEALTLRARRAEVISNNIANADTPNFKARDLDFKAALEGRMSSSGIETVSLVRTQSGHQPAFVNPDFAADLLYRIPQQPAVDGNTVEVQEEMARFTDNALRYQASFEFLDSKFSGLKKAIKGE
ncbi:flagellar basal body rod protein FlgB [Nitrincola tapanii]|uniref:Flagellar basal body rod protein FlgB n=1 Tax=Nitrincola tapanii TaxID=1708751 RepID=A0A5A9W709_9GAMM|nr:flagellar basal body rod protein FlgB [Nitrincola tapanii]KAA0876580.1 flagellar basal body rod protein FlgB [Nitrincola tapanii]